MNENKGELIITVPYEDFVSGVQALQTIIAIRRILKEKEGYASGDIMTILELDKKKNPVVSKEVKQDDGAN